MTPTVGRIVHYTLSEGDEALLKERYADAIGRTLNTPRDGKAQVELAQLSYPGQTWANLQVFLDGAVTYWATSRSEGENPGTWAWPPRVGA